MRVLAITSRADIGGGPEHLFQLTKALAADVSVTIAAPRDEPYFARFCELVGEDNVIEIPHRAFRLSTLRQLRSVVRRNKVDVIHSHGKGAGTYSRPLAMLTRRPVVHTFHGVHVGEYGTIARTLYLLVERLLGLVTAAGISVSAGEQTSVLEHRLVPTRRSVVVDNGVVIPTQLDRPEPSATLRIVAVNRYDHQKNPELLVRIIETLGANASIGPVKLTVLGTGDKFEHIDQTIRASAAIADGRVEVELVGATTTPRAYFQAADVFLSTSRWEGMPLAVLEAMSEGLPVVATNVVGNRDVVDDGVHGLLFDNDDAASAVDALKRCTDADLVASLGDNARHRAATDFSVEAMANATADVYRRIHRR